MCNWDDWSDFEINAAVTCINFGCEGWELNGVSKNFFHCGADGSGYYVQQVIDYCNNWADMGQLIVDNKISIVHTGSYWQAQSPLGEGVICNRKENENPLRAAAIVFLMMNEVEP